MASSVHASRRWMTPGTKYQWLRLSLRFEAFRSTTLPGRSLPEQVQEWLQTLPSSQQSPARCALKLSLGKAALDWSAITVARHHRNDAVLQQSVLRDDQRPRIRAATTGPKELAIVECLWTMRRCEVAALKWSDVDLSQGMVLIMKGKGSKPSWTLLMPEAQAALGAWFEAAQEPPDESPVFPVPAGVGHPKRIGGPYTPGGIGKIIQAVLTRAGCWSRGIGGGHRFRRTMATAYLREHPGDIVGLARIMRHEQISTTERYAFLQPDDLAPRLAKVRL